MCEPPKFVIIEACDFQSSPHGGQLNFVRNLLGLYKNKVATVGYTLDDKEPIGEWFLKEQYSFKRWHFNLYKQKPLSGHEKYKIPKRIIVLLNYIRFEKKIASIGCKKLFLQEHSILIGLSRKRWESVCYRFPGVESQMEKSRYAWAKKLSVIFDYLFYRSTKKADVLLASADQKAISEMRRKSFGFVNSRIVNVFPTRVDTNIFKPKINKKRDGVLKIISSGRLHWVKGWDLTLNALKIIEKDLEFQFTYIGDGPDKNRFEQYVESLSMQKSVECLGYQSSAKLADLLRSCDLYLLASHMEGWPTALVEAYVAGVPMVSTNVSGSTSIIEGGVNGYVCNSRDPLEYSNCIIKALNLNQQQIFDSMDVSKYSTKTLGKDLEALWEGIR